MPKHPSFAAAWLRKARATHSFSTFILFLAVFGGALTWQSIVGHADDLPTAVEVAQPTPCAARVYSNNFEGEIGPEWSTNRAEVTPTGNRRFLGQFGNETASLALSNLPQHTKVTLAFDLYIIRTWDGNGPKEEWGPDFFEANADNGQRFIRSTFTVHNHLFQSYPDDYPRDGYRARTGAVENDTLGYTFNGVPKNSVYRIEKTISHTGSAIKINFLGAELEALNNESWGIDNLVVTVDCPPPSCATRVYNNTFETTAAGPEWSRRNIDTTPAGNRRFLGRMSNETNTLTLSNLPEHKFVTVAFDVYVIKSWDGNSDVWGPDIFDARVENGPTLTRTTFSLQAPWVQAYPGEYPGGSFAPGTGAVETNVLGYVFDDGEAKDAVFRITKTVAHTDGNLKLNFSASGLEWLENESWGIDNISVITDCVAPPVERDVYSANFETTVGSEWSKNNTEVTPQGGRRFLGQFTNETVSLSLTGLPQHTEASVTFDVYIARSWDGNSIEWGPDIFDTRVENGPVITRTTFSLQSPLRQAFPGEFPGGDFPTGTGAIETNTLGYIFSDGVQKNAIFRITKTIPHTGSNLKINFSASGLEFLDNESWGIDNVRIKVNSPVLSIAANEDQ